MKDYLRDKLWLACSLTLHRPYIIGSASCTEPDCGFIPSQHIVSPVWLYYSSLLDDTEHNNSYQYGGER